MPYMRILGMQCKKHPQFFVASGLTEGLEVKLARVALGLRQSDVAKLAEVPPWAVSSLETAYRRISSRWKRRIRETLGLDATP